MRICASRNHRPVIAQLRTQSQSPAVVHARLPAEPAAVGRALGVARGFAARAGLGHDVAERLAIVVEEWIANLVEHGDLPSDSRIGLRLARAEFGVRITVTDAGRAFDPRRSVRAGPNLDRGGGAGLELIRAWTQVRTYGRRARRNRLVLEMPLS